MVEKFKSNNNVVYSCKYHVIFCPKYRRKVLVSTIASRLKELLAQIAIEIKIEILEMEIMPDHVAEIIFPELPCAKHTLRERGTPKVSHYGGL